MFGPDRCGATNKVHFILQHKLGSSDFWEGTPFLPFFWLKSLEEFEKSPFLSFYKKYLFKGVGCFKDHFLKAFKVFFLVWGCFHVFFFPGHLSKQDRSSTVVIRQGIRWAASGRRNISPHHPVCLVTARRISTVTPAAYAILRKLGRSWDGERHCEEKAQRKSWIRIWWKLIWYIYIIIYIFFFPK